MDTVRLARDLGDVSGLLPTGISRLRDIPHQLLASIKAALIFLSWEENLPKEEIPPRSIWTDMEALNTHFGELARKRKARFDGRDPDDEKRNSAVDMLIVG